MARGGLGALVVSLGLDAVDFIEGVNKAERATEKLVEATKKQSAAIDREIKSLEKQVAVLGMSAREMKLYEMATNGATAAQLRQANAALTTVDNFNRIRTVASAAGAAIGLSFVALPALLAATFNSIVKGIDDLNDLKDATGASVENLSALQDVARRTGTEVDVVGSAIIKLNMALNAKPDSDQGRVLKALGLDAEELKRADPAEALRQMAVAFVRFADDGNKGRAILELTGKEARTIAPLLKDLAEKGELVAKVTAQQAEEAEKYRKIIFGLQADLLDAARSIAGPFVTALNDASAAMKRAREEGGGTFAQIVAGQKAIYAASKTAVFGPDSSEIDGLKTSLAAVNTVLETGNRSTEDRNRLLTRQADLQGQIAKLAGATPAGAFRPSQNYGDAFKPSLVVPNKPDKPRKGADAEAILRKELDGQVKAIRDFAQQQRDAYQFANRYVEGVYQDGLISLQDFFAAEARIRDAGLASQLSAIDKEVAALEAFKKKAGPKERVDAENKIAEAVQKRALAIQQSGQANILSAQEEARATVHLRERYDDLRASILQLQGDTAGAARSRIDEQVQAAQKLINQAANLPKPQRLPEGPEATVFRAALEGQQALSEAQRQYNRLLEQQRDAEESILIAARTSGATETETLAKLGASRSRALAQLAEMVTKANELALASGGNPEALRFAEQLAMQFKRAAAEVDPLLAKIRDVSREMGDSIAGAFEGALIGGKGLRETLKAIEQDMLRIVTRELITKPFAKSITDILGGTGKDGGILGQIGIFGGQKSPVADAAGAASAASQSAAQAAQTAAITAATAATTAQTAVITSSAAAETAASAAISAAATTSAGALAAMASAATSAAAALASVATSSSGSSAGGALGALGSMFGGSGGYGSGGGDFGSGSSVGNILMADGTNRVPYDGFRATLHRDEAVVPAKYNPAVGAPAQSERTLNVTNNFTLQGDVNRKSQAQLAAAAGQGVRRVMARDS